jgi:hypothetical protein
MEAKLYKLLDDAAEYKRISDLTTDPEKQDLFHRLSEHLSVFGIGL